MITNQAAGTRIDEVADGIYRISTPVTLLPGGFSFNQYLLAGEEPLLFHTGPRRMFPLVGEAIEAVLPAERLRYVGLSHFENDECGAINELLAGDLFTQPGAVHEPLTMGDILGPSEAMRAGLDYYAHAAATRPTLERLAGLEPATLACMHGSAWQGDGGALIRELADVLEAVRTDRQVVTA